MLGLGSGMNKTSSAEAAAIAGRLPGFTGLLDESYGASAEAAYSVRKLTNRVSVAMTIRRDSDSTETDIGFDSNGNLDEGAITAFCTGSTCRVVSWKDQSGNDNHAVQAVASNQPTIYTGGALVKENGKVAVDFDGSNNWLDLGTNQLGSTELFADSNDAFSVYQYATIDTQGTVFSKAVATQANRDYQLYYQNEWAYYIRGAFTLTGITDKRMLSSFNWDGSNAAANFNGTSQTVNIGTAGKSTQDINIGARSDGGFLLDGKNQEIIVYDSSKSASDRTSIEENVGDYFTQNTPLLDTYSGAAAAYSLRKLSSSYSGPAIRVRRDNDNFETDINFNVFGGLDTVSLAAHCGSNNGYVTNWYDQSSNSNTARQTTAANQPKIYDGTTGVVTENGKPAVEFNGTSTEISAPTVGGLSVATCFIHHTNFDANARMFGQFDQFENSFFYDTVTGYWAFNNGGINLSGLPSTTSKLVYAVFDNNGGELGINGATATSGTLGVISGQMDLKIGRRNASYWKGTASELIVYDSDESATRTGIETNINTFYSIY